MIMLTVNEIHHWLAWLVYVLVWGWAEQKVAQSLNLKAKHWILIIGVLLLIDALILFMFH
ncbi:MAG: hypothetical protein DCO95_01645 [Roseivirga sp. XM-24bin3]|nr:MAG: hypothetical protein DCO95_01645 [Roseivirga sp. XM-24bin3]